MTATVATLTCRSGRHQWTEANIYPRPDGRPECRRCRDEVKARSRRAIPQGWWLPNMPDAACREYPDLPWVPDVGGDHGVIRRMRGICAGCPELERCREVAVATPELLGVWGGLTTRERAALRGEARR
jgi:WhiB family transcriptional regulator, redox-sensing transcriptional regulator